MNKQQFTYAPDNQVYELSDNSPQIGDQVVTQSGQIVEVKNYTDFESLVAMGAKLVKQVPVEKRNKVSPYVYPGLELHKALSSNNKI